MSLPRRNIIDLRCIIQRSNTSLVPPKRSYTCIRSPTRLAPPSHQPVTRLSLSQHELRAYSSDSPTANIQPPDYLSEAEKVIFNKIKGELQPIRLEVQDISGGCGSMFGLDIVSPKFAGLSTIKQHQMVNRVLAEEIKGWHGMQLKTKAVE